VAGLLGRLVPFRLLAPFRSGVTDLAAGAGEFLTVVAGVTSFWSVGVGDAAFSMVVGEIGEVQFCRVLAGEEGGVSSLVTGVGDAGGRVYSMEGVGEVGGEASLATVAGDVGGRVYSIEGAGEARGEESLVTRAGDVEGRVYSVEWAGETRGGAFSVGGAFSE